jgi:hypothetical protein
MSSYNHKFKWVKEAVKTAKLVAYDECHKIYIAMDEASAEELERGGYTTHRSDYFLTKYPPVLVPTAMLNTVKRWYRMSCGLRFVQSVSNSIDPNQGFKDLIPQFEGSAK